MYPSSPNPVQLKLKWVFYEPTVDAGEMHTDCKRDWERADERQWQGIT